MIMKLRLVLCSGLLYCSVAVSSARCKCDTRGSMLPTVVVSDGAAGSTWLGQLLDNHNCSANFIEHSWQSSASSRPDGKVFVKTTGQLAAALRRNRDNAAHSKPYGIMLPWHAVDDLLQRSKGSSPQLALPGFQVILLLRDPFYWVLSQQKKLQIREDVMRQKGRLKCHNIHQRGTAACKYPTIIY